MTMYKATKPIQQRIMIGIPMTGLLRSEWVMARYSQVVPCNWSQVDMIRWIDSQSPIGYMVADARNIIATEAINGNFEWLLFIDHDVILPMGAILKINEYMINPEASIVSGLYFTKSLPAEPLIYRKRGNGYYADWTMGDKVWVDGVPMGCTLIDVKLIKAMADEVEEYMVEGRKVKRIFETPSRTVYDPETNGWNNSSGTEDLEFCSRVIDHGLIEKAGYEPKEFPFILDTSLFCKHIDFNGTQYPAKGEELAFMKKQKPTEIKKA